MTCLQCTLGEVLQPLQKLRDLFLGVYISDEDIFYAHIDQCDIDLCDNPYGPDGCADCERLYGEEVRALELIASTVITKYLPSLERISWSTFFPGEVTSADDCARRRATFQIQRHDGEVALKRDRH